MKTVYANRREDPECPTDHIEVRPGNLANAPRRVSQRDAVGPLREAHLAQQKLEAEIAERSAALAEARAKAVAIQDKYDELRAAAEGLPPQIARAESELATSQQRIVELELHMEQNWERGIADSLLELQRRQCLVERLPKYLEKMRSRLADLKIEIAAFAAANGIGSQE